ncbi:MAG: cadmium-translocating P-type ATPase [Candidatus Latescibacteria bacterium]|nr:cadmium-translocating P-type ATPase [Candidatus Latescibacterota bacterium]
MQTVELPYTPPEEPHGRRCADLLVDILSTYRGIAGIAVDEATSVLTLRYDPALISLEKVEQVARQVGIKLRDRFGRCTIRLTGLNCQDCARTVERGLARVDGVPWATVNFAASVLRVEYREQSGTLAEIERRLDQLGYAAGEDDLRHAWRRHAMALLTGFAGACLLLGWGLEFVPSIPSSARLIAYLLASLTGGYYGLRNSVAALRAWNIDINLLMVVAAVGATVIGRPQEGAVLLFLFSLSNTLETYAMGRTHRAIRGLMDLSPPEALVRRDDQPVRLPVAQVEPEDVVIVKPGERIPVDGRVIAGESSADQSAITGESVPVTKRPGDSVYAGTMNLRGTVDVFVTARSQETTLARVIALVEEAQSQKAPTQQFTEWIGQYYTIGVLSMAVLVFVIPTVFFGRASDRMLYRAMTLLVVASPCALIISTPAAVLSALANGARRGILFKGGAYLEGLAKVRAVAFDKTGTLTAGRLHVTGVVPADGVPQDEVLRTAAAVESGSEHPIAAAIVAAAHTHGLHPSVVASFQAITGQGAQGLIDGQMVRVGKPEWVGQFVEVPAEMRQQVETLAAQGRTTVLVGGDRLLGLLAVSDIPRPAAHGLAAALHRLGVESVVMLTGDHPAVARTIGAQLGLDEVRAGLLPHEKVQVVRELLGKYDGVAMIGDGVNDAPALAAATVGIAMGVGGTNVALDTSDVVLMGDDLAQLPIAFALSRRASRIIRQNLIFAVAVIITLIISTLIGRLSLPVGVIGHEGSTLLVVLNGLRLLGGTR